MSESLSSPERQESGSEYEADLLVTLNEAIEEVRWWGRENTGHHPPDLAPDALAWYCGAIAKRDPAFGRLLVRKLVERSLVDSGSDIPRDDVVEQHRELARNINDDLIEAGQAQPGWLSEEWARKGKTLPDLEQPSLR